MLRIVLVPVFVVLVVKGRYFPAMVVFVVATVTDGVDGLLARRLGQRTEFGTYMDPLADKLLTTAAFIVLASIGWIPLYLCLLAVGREVVIISGTLWLKCSGRGVTIEPAVAGKVTTFAQVATILYAMIRSGSPDTLLTVLVVVTALLIVYSGFFYIIREIAIQKKGGRQEP